MKHYVLQFFQENILKAIYIHLIMHMIRILHMIAMEKEIKLLILLYIIQKKVGKLPTKRNMIAFIVKQKKNVKQILNLLFKIQNVAGFQMLKFMIMLLVLE